MGTITHKAGRVAVGKAADVVIKNLDKDREKEILKLVDFMEKYMDGEKLDVDFDSVRKKIKDKDSALNKYINKALDEIDPNVLKTMVLNLGFEAFLNGTKTIRKMREKYNCNVPWLILMDPTSACNLHCTGCWAAEYGNRLNLTFDEMDSVVTQGKELGIYLYMFTGGEPLVRKSDIIKLCEKHNDCAFLSFTNGTLVDEAFCQEMKRVGNLYLAISLEGFEAVNDLRRGDGVYGKVMNAMDLLKKNGLVMMCGDGINDSPVLASADFSISIGEGTEIANNTADAILISNNLSTLPDIIKISKKTMRILKENIVFSLLMKVVVLTLGVLGFAPIWLAVFADVGVTLITVINSIRIK